MSVLQDGLGSTVVGAVNHNAGTQFMITYIHKGLEQIPGSGGDVNGKLFYTVEAYFGHFISCSDKELTCVVCTK